LTHQVIPGGVVRHFFDKPSSLFLDIGRCHPHIPLRRPQRTFSNGTTESIQAQLVSVSARASMHRGAPRTRVTSMSPRPIRARFWLLAGGTGTPACTLCMGGISVGHRHECLCYLRLCERGAVVYTCGVHGVAYEH